MSVARPKDALPILVVEDLVLFPSMVVPLTIQDEKSIRLIEDALSVDRRFGYFLIRTQGAEIIHPYDLYEIGAEAEVTKMTRLPDGRLHIVARGVRRIRLKKILQRSPYLLAQVEPQVDAGGDAIELRAMARTISGKFLQLAKQTPHFPEELPVLVMNLTDPVRLGYLVASNLNISLQERQKLLETPSLRDRLERLGPLLDRELEIARLGQKLQKEVTGEMERLQKEHLLREQIRAIRKELGERDDEAMELRERLELLRLPAEARTVAEEEIARLARIAAGSPEHAVSRTYIDWIFSLPWSTETPDAIDLRRAKRILDEDHFGLSDVKERILEVLAVRRLKPDARGPILCFAGPPGVGKTSLGQSIARSMGRRFARVSLGGIRDEAEIRGHRRTYVGSLPGRIIQSLKRAGSRNPVIMLDEIDKLGSDFRGDPAAALLEVLDPEQNRAFADHYLDVPFDLSRVLFIATANVLDPVPPALADRLEVIELPGYSDAEKLRIARRFLLPKQVREHGLARSLRVDDESLKALIGSYTREAGLRNLEREIAALCRKAARRGSLCVTARSLPRLLGPAPFDREPLSNGTVGVATGLAWTRTGGEVLTIEATRMPGSKTLTLTGQLGDVMKESAQAALSWLRAASAEDFYAGSDLHIHVPAGAVPKDGPSAGLAIVAALHSLVRGVRPRHGLAMTGEITLRGHVLPVGGIKEKLLAAQRAGVKLVILPERNRKDVPRELRRAVDYRFVKSVEEMIRAAF
jgi:ATP-dependent Lon protease